ncbi:poly-beta-1,6-N-acetyl-D-glucosamine N-deacetylase PgaB [Azoarcus sp. DN11]|uniref:poly-beta-1,6-N-acetyl-D-glucosamine N-deacetylase PgaB n=1 Tax=Azoarcus sp. DN11 TaxID=356837 RepID=UPI0013E29665|nr:poly-beta-1,6-N-acetyl-D-glucosamine N-deacetylase PgaB [Azoarcus sp. DN11]
MALVVLFLFSPWLRAESYQVLCYHDIVDTVGAAAAGDTLGTKRLTDHFDWLRDQGYHVISVQDLVDARRGAKPLPPKAVLLTFDDAYESFYRIVFPLLKAYRYPATLAVVGSWLKEAGEQPVNYGELRVSRQDFLSVPQLREIAASGLVEIASHSYDLHHGIRGNAEGNEMPAATTRRYDQATASYESEASYEARVVGDLARNSEFLEKLTGRRPRVMVWPYGRYSGQVQDFAARLGMTVTMNLDDGDNELAAGLSAIRRHYLKNDPTAAELAATLVPDKTRPMRVMHVDLDYIYDANPEQQERNLGLLLERIKLSGVNTVFLQAFADDDASGVARRLYFPNRHLPVKADLFGRASWQIATRTGARVFAWLPLTAFVPPGDAWQAHMVRAADGSRGVGYARLSPFSDKAREFVAEIYEDLGRYAYFSGLLIHDDATLSDMEDASPFALDYYAARLGLPRDVAAIRANPAQMARWTQAKTEHLSWFAGELRNRVEKFRQPLQLARNYFAAPLMDPDAEARFAQSLPDAVRRFDWIAVMAMPYMEKAEHPQAWLDELVGAVRKVDGAERKVVFELQAKKWSPDEALPSAEIAGWMRRLRAAGIRSFGYYPDDPFANRPDIDVLRKELSLQRVVE